MFTVKAMNYLAAVVEHQAGTGHYILFDRACVVPKSPLYVQWKIDGAVEIVEEQFNLSIYPVV